MPLDFTKCAGGHQRTKGLTWGPKGYLKHTAEEVSDQIINELMGISSLLPSGSLKKIIAKFKSQGHDKPMKILTNNRTIDLSVLTSDELDIAINKIIDVYKDMYRRMVCKETTESHWSVYYLTDQEDDYLRNYPACFGYAVRQFRDINDPDSVYCRIGLRKVSLEAFLEAPADALQALLSTLLHEFLHGVFQLRCCHCSDCSQDNSTVDNLGLTEHGYEWQRVTATAQQEVNELLGLYLQLGGNVGMALEFNTRKMALPTEDSSIWSRFSLEREEVGREMTHFQVTEWRAENSRRYRQRFEVDIRNLPPLPPPDILFLRPH